MDTNPSHIVNPGHKFGAEPSEVVAESLQELAAIIGEMHGFVNSFDY